MKNFTFLFLLLSISLVSNGQLRIYDNDAVKIGNTGTNTQPAYSFQVAHDAYFECIDPVSGNGGPGVWFGNLPNNYTPCLDPQTPCQPGPWTAPYTHNDPVIHPYHHNSVWLGAPNSHFYQIMGLEIWSPNSFRSWSDASLKSNVENLAYGVDEVMKLRPVKYDMNYPGIEDTPEEKKEAIANSGKNHIGLIAQEVKEVIPEVVKYHNGMDKYAITYMDLVTVLIKATQEQQEQIELQKEELARLKEELKSLDGK